MRPVLITGGTGTLGSAFARICDERGLAYELPRRSQLDITNGASVGEALARWQPWLVVNTAGYVRVDEAETDCDGCHQVNTLGAARLARACAHHGVQLVTFSTDLVFDGAKGALYDEHDAPAPLSMYGRSKYDAEQRVLGSKARALVIRTAAFFGPWDAHNFLTTALRDLAAGRNVRAAADATVSPTYVPDLVNTTLDLAIDGETGLWHLANAGAITWAELARDVAARAGHPADGITALPARELGWRAPRPAYSALGSARGVLMPALGHALDRYHAALKEQENR